MEKLRAVRADAKWLAKQPDTCMEGIKPKVARLKATPDKRTPEQKMAEVKATDESTK